MLIDKTAEQITKNNPRIAEFKEVQLWFVVKGSTSSQMDREFYVVISPEQTIAFLQEMIKE